MINTLLILLMSCPINSTSSARSALPDFLQTFHKFHNLDTGLDLRRLTSGFHEAFATGAASPAGNVYPSGHLVPFPFWGLAYAPIVETNFTELAVSFLDFSP